MRPIIAVIDADSKERHTLSALLGAMDVEVKLYNDAESFLVQRAGAPACLITEVRLPGISGLQLLRQLRTSGENMAVILLASEAEVPTAVEAMRLGATDFIEKSQMDVALLRRVSQVLRDGVKRQ
ncbi:MAG TPA: response regulator [Steroidobacteraceae bacterium]|nr:response regulator [Steroidobacteraceae bacterium]